MMKTRLNQRRRKFKLNIELSPRDIERIVRAERMYHDEADAKTELWNIIERKLDHSPKLASEIDALAVNIARQAKRRRVYA